ncbi:MAG: hypothetical protein IPP47_14195 [Bryobacterales bacterium]|nr:hypothetical protein [Bryobacterales bacterium]
MHPRPTPRRPNPRLLLTLLLATAHAQTPLPPATSEAKVLFDQILTLEATPLGGRILVRDRAGKTTRIVEAGAGLDTLRRAEVRDFTLTRDGILAIAFHAILPMGASARYLGLYPLTGPPRLLPLDDIVCQRLAADDLTGIWCLGRGRDQGIAHRLAGERAGRWSLAAPKGITLDALPQLFSSDPGVLQAWLPAAATLIQWDTITGEARLRPVPLLLAHALTSLTITPNGTILALLPLRAENQPERLDTPYALFSLQPNQQWQRLPNTPTWPRGATLAGPNAIWNRLARRIDWLP